MRMASFAACIVLFVSIYSCGDKKKQVKILDTKQMQLVLWDMLQAEAYTDNFLKKDSSRKEFIENAALQKKIFELHNVRREDFDSSYKYYHARPEEMKIILDSIIANAERDRNKSMQERYGKSKPSVQ